MSQLTLYNASSPYTARRKPRRETVRRTEQRPSVGPGKAKLPPSRDLAFSLEYSPYLMVPPQESGSGSLSWASDREVRSSPGRCIWGIQPRRLNPTKSNQIKPNQTKSNQIKPNQTKSNQIKPNQTKSNQIKPN